jgi:hypothetical protein
VSDDAAVFAALADTHLGRRAAPGSREVAPPQPGAHRRHRRRWIDEYQRPRVTALADLKRQLEAETDE